MTAEKYIVALAGASQLEALSLLTSTGRPSETSGHQLFKHVINVHGSTLKVLKVPNFHLPMENLWDFFVKCEGLKELWCGVTYSVMVGLSICLQLGSSTLAHPTTIHNVLGAHSRHS